MVEKRIANSGGQTEGTDLTDGIEGTDETDGTDGTDAYPPGSWFCFLSKRQRTLENPGNIYIKSGKHKLRIFQDHSIMGPSK